MILGLKKQPKLDSGTEPPKDFTPASQVADLKVPGLSVWVQQTVILHFCRCPSESLPLFSFYYWKAFTKNTAKNFKSKRKNKNIHQKLIL